MLFTDVIRQKRDGEVLSPDAIQYFVRGLADNTIPAEQVSALAMAIFLNGLSTEELCGLTGEMVRSGTVLDWRDLDGPVIDKHSTGGVGDKVSFLLAPIVAACGGFVPMIAGRGLGHTGGTVDKIEAIPGYRATTDFDEFRRVVSTVGCAIIGQTSDLAPADRRLYSIRDVTGTVESIPLITASILSKKIAAGLHGLVMDIKVGNGAFMESEDRARELRRCIINTAEGEGLKVSAVLTDMNEVLGDTVGNALEIVESIEFLRCERREDRLSSVTLRLCGELLVLAGLEGDVSAGIEHAERAVVSGDAARKFSQMVSALGGPADIIESYATDLPSAAVQRPFLSIQDGYVGAINTRKVGNALIALKGGRSTLQDSLNLSVGFTEFVHVGDQVQPNSVLCNIHAASDAEAEGAEHLLRSAITITESRVDPPPVIRQ